MPKLRRTLSRIFVETEVNRLQSLNLDELRNAWRVTFKKECGSLSRDLLLRMLVWKIQEKAFGGHDKAAKKALDQYGRTGGNLGGDDGPRHVRAGSVLVREYQGIRHTVTVARGEFLWQEKSYPNLSKIAREITGVRWNGPRFFGLRQARKAGERPTEVRL